MEYSSVRWKTWLYPGVQELNYCLSSLNTQELLRAAFAVFAARHVHSPPRTICTRHLALFGHNRLDAKGTMHRWEDENCPWIALVRSLQCQCATRELENKRLRLEVQSDFHWICSKSGKQTEVSVICYYQCPLPHDEQEQCQCNWHPRTSYDVRLIIPSPYPRLFCIGLVLNIELYQDPLPDSYLLHCV